jgi:hypothetical protein
MQRSVHDKVHAPHRHRRVTDGGYSLQVQRAVADAGPWVSRIDVLGGPQSRLASVSLHM